MATDRYSIQIDTTQAQQALNGLKSAIGGVAAALSIKEFVSFADSVTSMRNKLAQLNPDIASTNAQFKGLADIAMRSRAPLEEVVTLYSRMAKAGQELGVSQKDIAGITESIAKALSASGTSASEASGALLQLGQAFQSGKFQGDELRSILENLPSVSRALADSLGVPVGALKELGSQGKITSTDFVNAMKAAAGSIEQDFAKTTPTISQAFTNLKTAAAEAFYVFESNTQVGRDIANVFLGLAEALKSLAQNADAVAGPLTAIAKVAISLLVFTAVGRAITVLAELFTGIVAVGSRLAAIFTQLFEVGTTFFTAAQTGITSLTGLGGAVGAILSPLGELLKIVISLGAAFAAWTGIDKLWESLKGAGASAQQLTGDVTSLNGKIQEQAAFSDKVVESTRNINYEVGKIKDKLSENLTKYQDTVAEQQKQYSQQSQLLTLTDEQKIRVEALNEAEQNYYNAIKPLMEEYNKLKASTNQVDQAKATEVKATIDAITKAYNDQKPVMDELIQKRIEATKIAEQQKELEDKIKEAAQARIEVEQTINDVRKDGAERIAAQNDKMELAGLTGINRELKQIEIQERRVAEEAKRRVEEQLAGSDPEALQRAFAEIDKNAADILAKRSQIQRADYEQQRSFATGWKQAFQEYADAATNGAEHAKKIFGQATKGLEDMIVSFAKTGKFEWKGFVSSMAETLLRSNIQNIFGTLLGGGTGGQGGISGLLGGLGGMLGGGTQASGLGSLLGGGATGIGGNQQGGGGLLGGLSGLLGGKTGGMFGGGIANGSQANPFYVIPVSGGMGFGGMNQFGGYGNQGSGGLLGSLTSSLQGYRPSYTQPNSAYNLLGDYNRPSGGGLFGGLLSGFGKLFGGFFATGGSIPGGRFGVVGEAGPELVSGPATVTPLGNTVVTYNINAVDAMSFKQMLAQDPSFLYAVSEQGRRTLPMTRR